MPGEMIPMANEDLQYLLNHVDTEFVENEIGDKLGFTVKSQNLQLTASCDKLKRNGACDKKSCD